MKVYPLQNNWRLKGFDNGNSLTIAEMEARFFEEEKGRTGVFELQNFPVQVHQVLIQEGIIENPNIRGQNPDLWIDDLDWCYLCDFQVEDPDLPSTLQFDGLDTFADIYLNGKRMAVYQDVYLQQKLDVTGMLQRKNRLMIYFRSSKKMVEQVLLPDEYKGKVPPFSAVRVFRSGFHEFNGPLPSLIRCGPYGPITLCQRETVSIDELKLDVSLAEEKGTVTAQVILSGDYQGQTIQLSLLNREGSLVAESQKTADSSEESISLQLDHPHLWWPRTHGDPYCYRVVLNCGGDNGDQAERTIGFRTLTLVGDFDYRINGKPLKLWGANLAHPDTLTNCYQPDRVERLLDLCELGHYNILRIWGESEIYPDEFYDECDRRGILLWQDFYMCYSLYSEETEFMEQCRKEAEQLVKRLRHHPSILLWCGGNEMFLCRDYDFPGERCFGEKIWTEIYPSVCSKLDPQRYYHQSSPCGGKWANDPSAGDTHGYTHLWFVPGRGFPVFLSENCRVSTPPMRTMKKMMTPQELWPDGYDGKVTRRHKLLWPETWCAHNSNLGYLKLGPIEHYYDADSAEEMIYRIGAAHAEYIRRDVERFRRGYSLENGGKKRITTGHMLWKFNNNSNIISYGIVDYFLEPYYPYYQLKRCYSPLLLSVEFADQGYIWLTNDTMESLSGTVTVSLFDMQKNDYVAEFDRPFSIASDESKPVCTLEPFGQFRKRFIVCAKAVDHAGRLLAECTDTVELERHMDYPESTGLSISCEGDWLTIQCKAFARCVELSGNEDGDEFGWLFSDNYFDLLPGVEKRVRILGKHHKGTITAKAQYDDRCVETYYHNA
jgi:beta-mannosidase